MNIHTGMPVLAPTVSAPRRTASAIVLAALVAVTFLGSVGAGPLLVSKMGLSQSVAESIARVIAQVGSVPWWALIIVGGGVAGVLVRLVVRYGWRYAASW
jgi:hypothetical protein